MFGSFIGLYAFKLVGCSTVHDVLFHWLPRFFKILQLFMHAHFLSLIFAKNKSGSSVIKLKDAELCKK